MLIPFLIVYVAIGAASLFTLVRSLRAPASFSVLMRLFLWVMVVGQSFYALRSPACVSIPARVAPAPPAVEKVLLGSDESGQLNWLEGRSPTAFTWGPRWWFRVGHAPNAGIEWVPPVRFAQLDQTKWEIVRADGSRHALQVPAGSVSPRGPTSPNWRHLLRGDGSFLSWDADCLRYIPATDGEARCLVNLSPDRRRAVTLLAQDHTLEVLMDELAFQSTRGQVRNLTILERDAGGLEVKRASLALPSDVTIDRVDYRLELKSTMRGLFLLEAWSSWKGDGGQLYRVADDLAQAQAYVSFDIRLGLSEAASLAISDDGQFFTTGQAVFRIDGQRIQELEPPLSWCVWDGHKIYGVRRYPFVGFAVTNRAYSFGRYLSQAEAPVSDRKPSEGRSTEELRQARKRSNWFLGGIDEAGRQDEIVEVPIQ